MQQFAQVIVLGHLGGDAEVKFTQGGHQLAKYRVAVTSVWKDKDGVKQEKTAWVDCVDWNKRPQWLLDKLSRGTPVLVRGNLEQESWEKDGERRSKLVVRVSDVEPLAVAPRGREPGDDEEPWQ